MPRSKDSDYPKDFLKHMLGRVDSFAFPLPNAGLVHKENDLDGDDKLMAVHVSC